MRCPQGGAARRGLYGYLLFAMEVTGARGGGTHTLACEVESSVGRRGTRLQRQPVPASVPACELFFVGLENVWIRAPEKGGKIKKRKAGLWRFLKYEERGEKNPNPQNNQIQPQVQHYRRTKKSKDGAAHQAGNWCALPPSPLLLWTRRRRGFQAPKPRSFLILWGSLTLLEPGGREKRERKSHKN